CFSFRISPPFLCRSTHCLAILSPHHPLRLRSFPTRRSSDLCIPARLTVAQTFRYAFQFKNGLGHSEVDIAAHIDQIMRVLMLPRDRKSTRLNSSHVSISYAVFCVEKKNHPELRIPRNQRLIE